MVSQKIYIHYPEEVPSGQLDSWFKRILSKDSGACWAVEENTGKRPPFSSEWPVFA